jgi:glyoxylase-like metal-dependent hydrolase (beta-lactamase superfamily II)
MIYAARTDSGVFVIDLGWTGADHGLRRVLEQIGATPKDVRWAFLTHAHRDHIAGWKHVMQATFVLGKDEVPLFTGNAEYRGWLTRLADRIDWYPRPIPSQVTVRAIGSDTIFVLGSDTLRAYPVPGHTPGSMAYLFRGVLFVGDAAYKGKIRDFQGARREFSDSTQQSKASMASLIARLDSTGARWNVLCTAHAKCAVTDSALRRKIQR